MAVVVAAKDCSHQVVSAQDREGGPHSTWVVSSVSNTWRVVSAPSSATAGGSRMQEAGHKRVLVCTILVLKRVVAK